MKRLLLIIAVILGVIISQAVCLEVDVSSSGGGTTTQMSTSYETTLNDFVVHDMKLTPQDGGISNHQYGTGGTSKSITVTDPSGNKAQSYFSVVANTDPAKPTTEYWFEFNPLASGPGSQSQIWLTAQNARSISAWSKVSNSAGNNLAQSSVSINSGITSPVTLASLDYWSTAYIDSNGFHSEQKASPGTGNSAPANPVTPSGSPDVPTLASGASGDKVIFTEQSSSSAGTSAKSSLDDRSGVVTNYQGGASVSGSLASTTSDASASGSSITVQNQESDGTNTFSLKSYATGTASYNGVTNSRSGDSAEQAISTLTGTGTVYIQDTRTKSGAVQQAALYPKSKSFIGTALSWDSGHIIQDNVNLAAPVSGAANINSRDTLALSAGTFIENVLLDKSLIIKGAGADKTVVDGNQAGHVFAIGTTNQDVDVSLSRMKIQGGSTTGNGGGILNYGRLALSSCTLSGNSAVNGGGIFNSAPGSVTVSGSTISGNTAGGIDLWGQGGGIANNGGKVTITDSSISNNKAITGNGGGIANSGTVTTARSTISGNTATICGGGIFNSGGTVSVLSSSTISSNSANYGGGIYSDKTLTVGGSSTVSSNTATNNGGGIYNDGGTASIKQSSTVSGNTAYWGGGLNNHNGIMYVTDSTASGNTATSGGGGIENWIDPGYSGTGGKLYLTRSTVAGNTALSPSGYGGGAIENLGGIVTVTGSTISGNTGPSYGGGIHNRDRLYISGSTISGNTGTGSGGAIYNDGATAITTVTSSTISNNNAPGGAGIDNNNGRVTVTSSTISGNLGTEGSGILNWGGGTTTLSGSTVSGNTADLGGGIVNWDGSTMNILSSTISGNTANTNGGGVYNRGNLAVRGTSLIINNQATTGYGGGIHSTTNTVTFDGTGVLIMFNKAHLPDPLPTGATWYQQYGVYIDSGIPMTIHGFNPATQVTGNTHI